MALCTVRLVLIGCSTTLSLSTYDYSMDKYTQVPDNALLLSLTKRLIINGQYYAIMKEKVVPNLENSLCLVEL